MAKTEAVTDVAILGDLDKRFTEAAALVPAGEVAALEARVDNFTIDNDDDFQVITSMGVTVSTWSASIEKFWDSWREYYFRRYQTVMAITKNGFVQADSDRAIIGTAKLTLIRGKIEHLMREYKIRRERDKDKQQATLDKMVEGNKKDLAEQVQELLLQGDFDKARQLRHEAANLHTVSIMRREPTLEGANVREPWKWTLEGEEGLMEVIKAVASGDVPLYYDVVVKGKPERRCLIELSATVLNYKARELGPELGIPGITVKKDMSFAFSRTGTA